MGKKTAVALIVTRSIALQQGLGALLDSLPGLTTVEASRDLSTILPWIESHRPRIVLHDMALKGNDLLAALEAISKLSPKTQRVLLVDQVSEVRWVPRYAEAILIKGAPASAVAKIVSNLLFLQGEENEHDDSGQ